MLIRSPLIKTCATNFFTILYNKNPATRTTSRTVAMICTDHQRADSQQSFSPSYMIKAQRPEWLIEQLLWHTDHQGTDCQCNPTVEVLLRWLGLMELPQWANPTGHIPHQCTNYVHLVFHTFSRMSKLFLDKLTDK